MALLLLLTLFVLAMLAAWLICFPEARAVLGGWLARRGRAVAAVFARFGRRGHRVLHKSSSAVRKSSSTVSRDVLRHRYMLLGIAALLTLPPLLVAVMHRHVMLDGYDESGIGNTGTAALVTSLLRGEQLVPPPPLPPAVFTTREVEIIRPHLAGASRNWRKLDTDFRLRLLAVFKIMKDRYGYDMALVEGYRSPQRQEMLTKSDDHVTNAGAFQSYHQYGLAADCAFYRDGKLVISEKDPWAMRGYQLYGKVAEAAGLVWGGGWKSIVDLGHVELHKAGHGPHAR